MVRARNVNINKKAKEMGVVEMSNTIVDPRTMMIYAIRFKGKKLIQGNKTQV